MLGGLWAVKICSDKSHVQKPHNPPGFNRCYQHVGTAHLSLGDAIDQGARSRRHAASGVLDQHEDDRIGEAPFGSYGVKSLGNARQRVRFGAMRRLQSSAFAGFLGITRAETRALAFQWVSQSLFITKSIGRFVRRV